MRFVGFALMTLFVVSCAHHKDVRPGVDGVHRVVIQTDDIDGATRKCIKEANHYCKQKDLEAAFITEDKKYTGDMKEEDYREAKRVTEAAKTVGGAIWVFGGRRASPLGGIVGLGGVAADSYLGDPYTVEMRFKCQ
jgi:hypothetical protein